ncbi:hypothetical protein RH858_04770 [Halalkaliarchaeum sp. AArc-GB]|uniref:hypothetical protein n=1 Tax=Halalkaliarchaeum sp. AArc-GB TaxID=3074078 RepID=UPI002864ED06|nr:hypothetical protein [Halalkaliarchaeum sp. AArc-GB]MDR5672462.1 hypothetical protein [Halalkaliarchaeum sp. AArc-GB]
MSTIDNSTADTVSTDTAITDIPDQWKEIPCVQYGFLKDNGPNRTPKLRCIFDPIPDDATTASPVYVLTREQYQRQQQRKNGYDVKHYTSVATKLQDECEVNDRVLYPIHVESDVYPEEGADTLIEWFHEFVEGYLKVPFPTCELYFSGNRSIHVHVPRFVSEENQRKRLKERAKTFCEETDAKLDCALYDRKRLFRLPGVEHAKTGLQKVKIEPEWEHSRIIREASVSAAEIPETYEAVLRGVFLKPSLTAKSMQLTDYRPHALFRTLDTDKTVLEVSCDKREIETPLIEQKESPDGPIEAIRWHQYNAKEFSPYALATGGSRSIAVVKVKGTPFARRKVRTGNKIRPIHALIPAYFYGARGCAGREFTKDHKHAPLQLSKRDYEKWNFEVGENVVIIGGKSNRSRIFRVERWQATVVGHALTGEGASRQDAFDYLENEGYDIGSAGKSKSKPLTEKLAQKKKTNSGPNATTPENLSIYPARENPKSAAERYQRTAEQEGIERLSHPELVSVASKHLAYGWNPTWEWFKNQFGSNFSPEETWKQLRSIVQEYPEYDHVEIPPKPC